MAVTDYSRTPSNNNSSPPNGFPEGQSAGSVNNCMRQVMTDIVNESAANACKVLASVSGTNTITGTLTPDLAAYSAGMIIVFTPANTNTGATTLNIDSLGALAVLNLDGTACVGGELAATIPALVLLNSAANGWIIVNLANQGLVIPITAANGNLTIAAGHLGRCVEYNGGGGHTYTFPVLANGGVVGVDNASNFTLSIAVSGTSLFWQNGAGGTVASPRTLAAGGSASMQFSTNTGAWKLKGAGIS